jgi:predicted nucleotidyltransferase component of viral defense system
LRALQNSIGEQFLFKGGTSLSKGWNLIERFSEDIDLLFQTEHNGEELSLKERHRRFKQADKIVAETPGFASVSRKGRVAAKRECTGIPFSPTQPPKR